VGGVAGRPVPFIGLEKWEQRRSGSNRQRLGGASRHDGFGFALALRGGGEMMGWSREREWMHRGGDPVAGGTWHGRHCGDGWNRWRRWLDD
jgi:hypothetical protein